MTISYRISDTCNVYPKLLRSAIGTTANDRHLSQVADTSVRIDPCVHYMYIRVHTRENIDSTASAACLLVCPLAYLCLCSSTGLVTLPHSNPHSRAPPRDRAQVTGLGYRCSGVPDTSPVYRICQRDGYRNSDTPESRDRGFRILSNTKFQHNFSVVKKYCKTVAE